MTTKAVFFSSLLSKQSNKTLTQAIAVLKEESTLFTKMKWSHPGDIHLTLAYIREVHCNDINAMKSIGSPLAGQPSMACKIGDAAWFGNALVLLIEPIEVFTTLRSTITDRLQHVLPQYHAQDKRTFYPHITIGRCHQNDKESLEPLTDAFDAAIVGMVLEMNSAALMQRKHHRPPHYATLEAYPFKQ